MTRAIIQSGPRPAARRSRGGATLAAPLLLAVLLAGCAVGPDYRSPEVPLPAAWDNADAQTPPEAPELSQWWRRLGDPVLGALIEEAVEGSLDVAAASARIREARASVREAGGSLQPSLGGTGSATRSGTAASDSNVSSRFQAGFDASWELDLFGANRRGVEAAVYGLEAAEHDLRATLLTLVGDVAANYVAARGARARIDYAERSVASQRETAELTRVRFDAGAATALDLDNATGQVSSTAAGIPRLRADYAAAVHRLSVLTGQPPAALAGRLESAAPIPTPVAPIPTGLPADLLRARPDLRQAERQLAQATARIGGAEAARYPSISLSGSLNTSAATIGEMASGSAISWAFGPTLTVPIFNGGRLAAAVEVAEARRDQSHLAFHAAVLTALEDVENAIVALTQERLRYERLAETTDAFRRAATLARDLYQTGATGFLEVLDAERSLYAAEDSLIQSRVAIATAYIALNKALGGGWDGAIDSGRPVVVDDDTGPRLYRPVGETS
ncbi:MAG: efflux transporter outer membrane subunit [Kiloniellaceae bacterium]